MRKLSLDFKKANSYYFIIKLLGLENQVAIIKSDFNNYMVYRFGKPGEVEFEFPAKRDSKSWKKFSLLHKHYSMGSGSGVNYVANGLSFKNYVYNVYKESNRVSRDDWSTSCGIQIINSKTGKRNAFTEIARLLSTICRI